MRLDRTTIAIRERTLFDIYDMALRVIFAHFLPLMICVFAIIAPLMLFNWWLIGWLPQYGDVNDGNARYIFLMIMLITIESPIISVVSTCYLGQVMFADHVDWSQIRVTCFTSLPALFLCHFVLRGVGIAWFLVLMIPRGSVYSPVEVWLIFVTLYAVLTRAGRPFINEIILLERSPLRSKNSDSPSIRKRGSALHGRVSGDLVARWIVSAFVATILSCSTLATMWFFWGMLLFDWNWGPAMLYVYFPLSLWLVAVFFSVVRFLCYLDLRIRREGWEVELVMRAAAHQLMGPTV